MAFNTKVGVLWKNASTWQNVAGTWKLATLWHNVAGTWKQISSVFTLSTNKNAITAVGFGDSDQANITSTLSTTFTFVLLSGSGSYSTGASSGTTTYVRVQNPPNGNGSQTGVVRVTASNGDYLDISFTKDWGTS